jgi:hypothetical protein
MLFVTRRRVTQPFAAAVTSKSPQIHDVGVQVGVLGGVTTVAGAPVQGL